MQTFLILPAPDPRVNRQDPSSVNFGVPSWGFNQVPYLPSFTKWVLVSQASRNGCRSRLRDLLRVDARSNACGRFICHLRRRVSFAGAGE
jgi:hypothetical protein